MRVLITGSKGQLGNELQKTVPQDIELTAIDVDQLDITDKQTVIAFVDKNRPNVIINAAAYTAVDKAESNRDMAFAVNADGPANLAFAAKNICARLIHVSTDYVFDGKGNLAYKTDSPMSPLGVYGESKLAAEQAILKILPERSVIIRTAWLYSSHGGNFVKTMLKLMSSRDSIGVVSDQVGTPTSATTLAEAIWLFVGRPALYGVYHFTDNGVASWYDFAVAIMEEAVLLRLLANEIEIKPITTADYPTPAKRPVFSVLDKSKTFKDIEIKGVYWRQALRQVLKDIKRKS